MLHVQMSSMQILLLSLLLSGSLIQSADGNAPEQKCKSGPVDLVFLIDGSGSVESQDFEIMRKFMIDMLTTLDIGLDATRVGVVQFSNQAHTEFSLKTHATLDSMVKGINQIKQLEGGTMTGLAIEYVMNSVFTVEEGDRPQVPNVLVIVTDGQSQDPVDEVAAEARGKGIKIFAVGVAGANIASLKAMASPPVEDHAFFVDSFDLIHQFGLQFQDKLCGAASELTVIILEETMDQAVLQCVAKGFSPEPKVEWRDSSGNILHATEVRITERGGSYDIILNMTVTKTDNYSCVVTQDEINQQTMADTYVHISAPEQKCKSGPVDLVFLIDGSGSVESQDFEIMRKFMIDMLATLDIGLDATRVGVVQFSSQFRTEFSLKTHATLDSMVKGINQIIQLQESTMTGLAIKYVMNSVFTVEEGDRPQVPNVLVIVTDGQSQDPVDKVAAEARGKGIKIFAVGVAGANIASLKAMASPPVEDHAFFVDSFDLIHQFGLQFQEKLCGAASELTVIILEETMDQAVLQCVAKGFSPEPKVEWRDSSGNILHATEVQITERGGSYDIILNMTVTKTDNYSCVVTQDEIKQQTMADTYVHISGADKSSAGPASELTVNIIEETKDKAVLQCVAKGFSPKSKVEWRDSSGNILQAEEVRITEIGGNYDIILNVTVTKSEHYNCVVTQDDIKHQTKADTSVHISDSCVWWIVTAWVLGILLIVLAVASVAGLYIKRHCKKQEDQQILQKYEEQMSMS